MFAGRIFRHRVFVTRARCCRLTPFANILGLRTVHMATDTPIARAKAMDHIVLTVKDIEATKTFYSKVLGMQHESFTSSKDPSVVRHALVFGQQKINLHKSGAEFEPKAGCVQPGSGDVCFLTDTPVEEILEKLKHENIEVLEGAQVVDRTGARGKLRSVYVRDPDNNLIEYAIWRRSLKLCVRLTTAKDVELRRLTSSADDAEHELECSDIELS